MLFASFLLITAFTYVIVFLSMFDGFLIIYLTGGGSNAKTDQEKTRVLQKNHGGNAS